MEHDVNTIPVPINLNNLTSSEFNTQPTIERKGKLIITSTVHHRDIKGSIQSLNCRISRSLDGKDTPVKRTLVVGTGWIKLDIGWIDAIGYLMVNNLGSPKFNKTPTSEQVATARAHIIEIGIQLPEGKLSDNTTLREYHGLPNDGTISNEEYSLRRYISRNAIRTIPLWLIHPSECFQGKPIYNLDLWMRCQVGEVTVTYFIVPN